jgi:hypothetical protein
MWMSDFAMPLFSASSTADRASASVPKIATKVIWSAIFFSFGRNAAYGVSQLIRLDPLRLKDRGEITGA